MHVDCLDKEGHDDSRPHEYLVEDVPAVLRVVLTILHPDERDERHYIVEQVEAESLSMLRKELSLIHLLV